jgi:hypothetical protein
MAGERPIVDECLARLRALEAVREAEFRPGPDDGVLVVTTDSGRLQYLVEVKRALNRPRLEHALASTTHRLKAGSRRLFLADFVPGSLTDVLEEAQVDFVDAAGNMLLRWPGKLYVHVKGMKPARLPEATASFLTTPNGLRVLFALLAEPGADAPAYRELSERAGASLGTVGRVALELQRRGFLVMQRRSKRRVLHRKRELLELWVGGYAERLRPQLIIGRFRSPDRDLADALKRLTAEGDGAFRWALTGGFASSRRSASTARTEEPRSIASSACSGPASSPSEGRPGEPVTPTSDDRPGRPCSIGRSSRRAAGAPGAGGPARR